MEEQGETDGRAVFFGEDDLCGMLHKQGMMDRGFVCDDIVGTSLIDGEPLDEVEDKTGFVGPCRADGESSHMANIQILRNKAGLSLFFLRSVADNVYIYFVKSEHA